MNRTTDPSEEPLIAGEAETFYDVDSIELIEPEHVDPEQPRSHWRRDATYWTKVARLRAFLTLMPDLLTKPDARAARIRMRLDNSRRTELACRLLGIPHDGTIKDRQKRLLEVPDVVYLLLACSFVVRKKDKALDYAAERLLTSEDRERWGENDRIDDRNLLAMLLFDRDPGSLHVVRVLDEWHSLSVGSSVLDQIPETPANTLEGFLHSEAFHETVAHEDAHFDLMLPLEDGGQLVALRRKARPEFYADDNYELGLGWSEEPVILHFHDGGCAVNISGRTGPAARDLAVAIGSAYFGQKVLYKPDLAASSMESIYKLIAAALEPSVPALELTGIEVQNTVIPGKSIVKLSGSAPAKETYDAMCAVFGDLTQRLLGVKKLEIRFEERIFGLYIRRWDSRWIVQFADARSDNYKARRFREHLWNEYGVQIRSKATGGRFA